MKTFVTFHVSSWLIGTLRWWLLERIQKSLGRISSPKKGQPNPPWVFDHDLHIITSQRPKKNPPRPSLHTSCHWSCVPWPWYARRRCDVTGWPGFVSSVSAARWGKNPPSSHKVGNNIKLERWSKNKKKMVTGWWSNEYSKEDQNLTVLASTKGKPKKRRKNASPPNAQPPFLGGSSQLVSG